MRNDTNPIEPPDESYVIVRSLAKGAPLAAFYRRSGPLWYRDGNGEPATWQQLIEMDESGRPVRMVTGDELDDVTLDRDRLERSVRWHQQEELRAAEYTANIIRECNDAKAAIRRVETVKCWTNEDRKRFVFVDDLVAALTAEQGSR